MTDIKWGPAIAVDGKRPAWLCDGEWRRVRSLAVGEWQTADVESPGDTIPDMDEWNWGDITAIRLPADHPHYRQTEEAPIDWSKPIEAVHEDGRVEKAARLRFGSDATWPDGEGQYHVDTDSGVFWNADGTPWGTDRGWRIRNVPQPTPQADTKPDLTARMEALVRKVAEVGGEWSHGFYEWEEARAIVALLPEPVDPDLVEAREIAAAYINASVVDVYSGGYDSSPEVACALMGLKRRALALAGEKEA